jgi:Amt family ammonium transporter
MLVDISKINLLDSFWVLLSSILVIFMVIPGLSLFYGGLVRRKNIITVLMKSFMICGLVTILWVLFGYSLSFDIGNKFIGDTHNLFLANVIKVPNLAGQITVNAGSPNISELCFVLFQLGFAVIAVALITGGFAERMKLSACLIFSAIWFTLVYIPVAHIIWSVNGFMHLAGFVDFAGGTVVHITSGVAGLICAIIIGKRRFHNQENSASPQNIIFTGIGAGLLWIGWFGFNGGSTFAFNSLTALVLLNTQIAAATGLLSWLTIDWVIYKRPSIIGVLSGAISGLVGITPAAGFVDPIAAVIIGGSASIACYYACNYIKHFFGYDDALDAFGIHGVGGIAGSILTGIFADKYLIHSVNLFTQIWCVLFVICYTAIMTTIIILALRYTIGIRVPDNIEYDGLDISLYY